MDPDRALRLIRHEADRIAAAVETGPLDAPVANCPGWDLRALAEHTGGVHRWAAHAVVHGRPPDGQPDDVPEDPASLAAWIRQGADRLAETLEASDPDADTWHPFTVEQKVWVWRRRQAIETMVHRWDAEVAVSGDSTIDPDLAAEAVHEYFEVGIPRVMLREQVGAPDVSLHVHCTDDDLPEGAGEWLVRTVDGDYVLTREHAKGDAALRGRAEDLLLVLMGRRDREVLDVVGDESAADAWLSLPGW